MRGRGSLTRPPPPPPSSSSARAPALAPTRTRAAQDTKESTKARELDIGAIDIDTIVAGAAGDTVVIGAVGAVVDLVAEGDTDTGHHQRNLLVGDLAVPGVGIALVAG